MSDLYNKIMNIKGLFKSKGASEEEISKAEQALGVVFAHDYKEYLGLFGAISFGSVEFTGLNVDKYINVVDVTLKERSFNKNFPSDCIVIENIGNGGFLILQKSSSEIFEWSGQEPKKIFENLMEYIDSVRNR